MSHPIYRFHPTFLALPALAMALLFGCEPKKPAPASYPEPRAIALQNVGGPTIDFVELREVTKSDHPARLARIAPLSRGQMVVLPRQKNAPALPAKAQIIWSVNGIQHSETSSLKELIRASTGAPNEALVVTFGASAHPSLQLKIISP